MNSTGTAYQRGDTFCRASDWIDVVTFFFLNYGLHAFTVVTEPGSTPVASVLVSIVAILMPSAGIGGAFRVLHRYANGGKTDLEVALKAGALCTIVPFIEEGPEKNNSDATPASKAVDKRIESEKLINHYVPIIPQMTQVHGQYPANPDENHQSGSENGQSLPRFSLVQVPDWFTVHPLIESSEKLNFIYRIRKPFSGPKPGEVNLACNYSFVKTSSAILQILYGSFELYRARGNQLEKYGYAAYSLTVIPYILMSLANLVASLSAPRYPSMFIVYYQGLQDPQHPTRSKPYKESMRSPVHSWGGDDEKISAITSAELLRANYPQPWWSETDQTKVEKKIAGAVGRVYGNFKEDPSSVSPNAGNSRIDSEQTEETANNSQDITVQQRIRRILGKLVTMILPVRKNPAQRGNNPRPKLSKRDSFKMRQKSARSLPRKVGIALFALCLVAAPYIIIQLLTGFKKGRSTRSQRTWIMCWIVIGQIGAGFASVITEQDKMRRLTAKHPWLVCIITAFVTSLLSVATLGGFVVVAQMMLQDNICRRL